MPASAPVPTTPLPLLSCVMPTFGRPLHVQEAVWCFQQQDYPNRELILLNDCPGQLFFGDVPGVRIYNLPERFETLGEKRNFGIELAFGRIILVWDDDDLSLPWRLSKTWEDMQSLQASFYRPRGFYAYWGAPRLHDNQVTPDWLSHGHVAFTKQLWKDVAGYPPRQVGEDAGFFSRVHQALEIPTGQIIRHAIDPHDRFYIMRGTSHYHHMSICGGEHPLDRTPGEYSIGPREIADPILRSAYEKLIADRSHRGSERQAA